MLSNLRIKKIENKYYKLMFSLIPHSMPEQFFLNVLKGLLSAGDLSFVKMN
jgi:hypothetical protein